MTRTPFPPRLSQAPEIYPNRVSGLEICDAAEGSALHRWASPWLRYDMGAIDCRTRTLKA